MDQLFFNRIQSSFVWVIIRYLIIIIGFIRSIIIANILTVNEMGQLAFVYLIIEYITLLLPFGSINSLNQQLSLQKSNNKNLNFNNSLSLKIYSTVLWILLVSFTIFLVISYLASIYLIDFLTPLIEENIFIISLIIIFSIIKSFAVVHIRMWDKWNRLILSEIAHSLIYLFGIYFYMKSGKDIDIIFYSLFVSIIISIVIIRFNFLDLRFFSLLSLKKIKFTSAIGFFLMINLLMETLFWGIDRFFIAIYLPSEELANFHIIHTYARAVLMFYASITFLFTPILYTNFNDLKKDRKKLLSKFEKITDFSESILIIAGAVSVIIIPFAISYLMPAYQNLEKLYLILIIGIILKNLAFFPMAYIVAVGLHRFLPIYSAILILFLITSYYIAYNFFGLTTAVGYSSVAVVCFMFFLILTGIHIIGFTSINQYLRVIYKIYFKIFLITIISIILVNNDNFIDLIPNVYLSLIIIVFLYARNFIGLFFDTLQLLQGNKDKFIRRFNY